MRAHLGLTIDTHIQKHSYDFKERKIIYAVVHTEIEIENSLWNKITSVSLCPFSALSFFLFQFSFLLLLFYIFCLGMGANVRVCITKCGAEESGARFRSLCLFCLFTRSPVHLFARTHKTKCTRLNNER